MRTKLLITGGCGFIGTNLVNMVRRLCCYDIGVIDKMSYASTPMQHPDVFFWQEDVADPAIEGIISSFQPDGILHLAAETHVDRSIHGEAANFVRSNVLGTHNILEAALRYWRGLEAGRKLRFRFVHVSTDEVFGSLDIDDPPFHEETRYNPRNPYAASKAGADHLTKAYYVTYGLPTIVTNCCNNVGPFQNHEKLIPAIIVNTVKGDPVIIHGSGYHVREWIAVEDHCTAILAAYNYGTPGESYCIGSGYEYSNLQIVHHVGNHLIKAGYEAPIVKHGKDRPGHDFRYAINCRKLIDTIGWERTIPPLTAIQKTVNWYLSSLNS
jgi:dTDP-glucose 4,6-dehydratase